MDIEEKLWDNVAKEIPNCEHETEAQANAIKLADETRLLGNYIEVEQLEEVLEGLVVGQTWQGDTRVVLFVKLNQDTNLTEELINKIKSK